MSISAISSSYGSGYGYDNSTSKKKNSNEDPLSQAISSLQDKNPELAAKLQKISDDAAALKKGGASEKEVRESVHKAMDGLSSTDKSAVREAMGPPPSGGPGRPSGPPPPRESDSDDSTGSTESSSTFDLASYLNSLSSSQNETIVNFLQKLASAASSSTTTSATATA